MCDRNTISQTVVATSNPLSWVWRLALAEDQESRCERLRFCATDPKADQCYNVKLDIAEGKHTVAGWFVEPATSSVSWQC